MERNTRGKRVQGEIYETGFLGVATGNNYFSRAVFFKYFSSQSFQGYCRASLIFAIKIAVKT
jgi:hypothetical protein